MAFKISNVLEYDSFIALDIWSFKIKVLVCKIEYWELKIIWKSYLRQNKKDFISWEIADLSSVSKSISKAILKACQNLEEIPKDIVVWFNSSSLLYDHISINYVRQSKDSPIWMKEIDEMIKNIEYKSLDKIKTKIESRLWIIDSEMRLITTSIVSIYIDWQRLSNPIGFTWKNVKLNLINIFSPSSKYNIIKNIIRDLDKNLISVVPVGISIPKLIEDSNYSFDYNLFIDFWYSKTTIIVENNSEILGFNIINYWLEVLEEELKRNLSLNYIDIENIIKDMDSNYNNHKEIFDNYFNLIFDSVMVASLDIEKNLFLKNIFISWGWASNIVKEKIWHYFEKKNHWKNILVVNDFDKEIGLKEVTNPTDVTALSLAKAWKEIIGIKKDPIARILRYILYKYE
ncbi:MAG: cell division protein (septum formation) [uncultured bacterium (gcode 4)]|uniref:Cell division protein (Septum formation) n=1 Tax=uncultured bacterium (gcode 4) TaxID=1234023 RepID=K2F596_9BACT|nr:MAG: cell division protein (septum formation) [uncultured bacterium (gcode 4)]